MGCKVVQNKQEHDSGGEHNAQFYDFVKKDLTYCYHFSHTRYTYLILQQRSTPKVKVSTFFKTAFVRNTVCIVHAFIVSSGSPSSIAEVAIYTGASAHLCRLCGAMQYQRCCGCCCAQVCTTSRSAAIVSEILIVGPHIRQWVGPMEIELQVAEENKLGVVAHCYTLARTFSWEFIYIFTSCTPCIAWRLLTALL